jgi:NitT/TauT family transport system substrate-binding protein
MDVRRCLSKVGVGVVTVALCGIARAQAPDHLRIAVGQCGSWDSSQVELGTRAGFYARHGIEIEARCVQGSSETQKAVISGGADVGIGVATWDALGAFAKGAPIRVIAGSATGSADFWIVNADSPLQTIKDSTRANTIAYSADGSSTQLAVVGLIRELGLQARPIATGGPVKTIALLLSGKLDIGWASPPLGFDLLDRGQVRIFARANDVPSLRAQTIRVNIANAESLKAHREVFVRFAQAFRETTDWMNSDPKALQMYADYSRITLVYAKRLRDEFFSRAAVDPDSVEGLDELMAEAMQSRRMDKPLTTAELAEFVQVPLK